MSENTSTARNTLAEVTAARPFSERHIGPDEPQVTEMLKSLGGEQPEPR